MPSKSLHGHFQTNTLPQQVPICYRKACGTQRSEEALMDTFQAPKNSSEGSCTGCQRLGKQNSFSQPKVFPFLEQETQFEDLQASPLNFVGLEWFTLQVLVWGISLFSSHNTVQINSLQQYQKQRKSCDESAFFSPMINKMLQTSDVSKKLSGKR